MNSIAKGTNSIAKVTNSFANGMNSIAKVMNSIAKTCKKEAVLMCILAKTEICHFAHIH